MTEHSDSLFQSSINEIHNTHRPKPRGMSPPRLNVQLKDRDQAKVLNKYIPSGMKRKIFLTIIEDLIEKFEAAESNGYSNDIVLGDIINGNLALRYEK